MQKQKKLASFEEAVLPHLNAAYNLAHWLTRNDTDAEDVVQEAYLRAFKFFGVLQSADTQMVRQALEELPVEFREVLVLRELEEMSYREIASITDLPLGTVMSRLARGRKRLQLALTNQMHAEVLS